MAHKRVRGYGAAPTYLVRTFPHGTDPSLNNPVLGAPLPVRNTVTEGPIANGSSNQNGRLLVGAGGIAGATGQFTVADNDFSTGRVKLLLGDHELLSNIDFLPGLNVGATATAVAAAISLLSGFSATALGAVVTVLYDAGPADFVDFRVFHYGIHVNFDPLVPATGQLTTGDPSISAPLIT